MSAVAFLAPPAFTIRERQMLQAVTDFLRLSRDQAISLEVESHDDAGIPPPERLGEFATIMRDADREDGVILCTVLLTREPGRRFVRLGVDGREQAVGPDLGALLAPVMRPPKSRHRR
jgi:hypothetical protein